MQTEDYCREIEAYLCRKNDGHLVRVVGPSFDLVSSWAVQGVPLKITFKGIDRYFERYYRKGPRRRPVRIDFCEHDVIDVFDEWRRATGIAATAGDTSGPDAAEHPRRASSLPVHLERVVLRLTSVRAAGAIDETFDSIIDRVALELDLARVEARGVRGEARQALIDRLAVLDRELIQIARLALGDTVRAALAREAEEELAGFRLSMTADVFARTREAAMDRLARERLGLPTIAFS